MKPLSYPILVWATNTHESAWFRVDGKNSYTRLNTEVHPKARYSDHESRWQSVNNTQEWEHETQEHLRSGAHKTRTIWESAGCAELITVAPEEIKNRVRDEFKRVFPDRECLHVPGNFLHEPLYTKMIEAVHEAFEIRPQS